MPFIMQEKTDPPKTEQGKVMQQGRSVPQDRPTKEAVFDYVKTSGPCLPNDAKKKLGADTIYIGAYLSELIADKKVLISTLRVGGSPLYYCPGQEAKLQDWIKYLNEKDRLAYDLLKEKRVLKDKDQTPLLRVSLRTIKDFAKPIEVKGKEGAELFWKWYLLPENLAHDEISRFGGEQEQRPTDDFIMTISEPKKAKVEIKKEVLVERPVQKPLAQKPLVQKPTVQKPTVQQHTLQEQIIKTPHERPLTTITPASSPKQEEQPISAPPRRSPIIQQEAPLQQTTPNMITPNTALPSNAFMDSVKKYFDDNNIEVVETTIVKKASEADFVLRIPTAIGPTLMYCKAKGKKTVNDGDLSSAYVAGEAKKLPVLYLTTGKLNKRAETLLATQFKNMMIKTV
jgi:hypothetical protein